MENKLEQLLNSLIEKGWKPFNVDCDWTNVEVINKIKDNWYIPEHSKIIFKTETHWHVFDCNIRDLVSKGSGLWQFVCENGKYGYTIPECWIKNPKICNEGIESVEKECNQNSYEYYIIESALCDEDKLEEFLLNSIKLD